MLTNRSWKTSLLTGLFALLTVSATLAQQMNYQGRLTDSSGNAVADAQYSITFDIYDAATGGTQLWGSQVIPADTVQGRFNVVIGPTDPGSRNIINAFNGGVPRYLQISYAGNPILPRQQILASPVAFRAMIADTVTNGAIGTAQIADGSITALKINGGTGVWVGSGSDIYHLNGNVGIGNTAPGAKLDVTGTLQVKDLGANSGSIHVGAYATGGDPKLIYFGDGNYVSIGENNHDDRMELTAGTFVFQNGNVGMGTTTPAAKLDVAGDVNVSGGISTGSGGSAMPGHTPIIIEEKTPNDHTTWNPHTINISSFANRPGGFKIRIYAQHETTFEVRNYEATVVYELPGYANDTIVNQNRISICWSGNQGRASIILGAVEAAGNNCSGYQETFPDGWVKIGNATVGSATGGCGDAGSGTIGNQSICVTFHATVGGRIVISDN
jgi:hypothetical protein